MSEKLSERIISNPNVMTGKPVIRGTRIPVEMILKMLAQEIHETEILEEYPSLEHEDILAAQRSIELNDSAGEFRWSNKFDRSIR